MKQKEFKDFFEINFDPLRSFIYYLCGDTDLATDIAQEVFIRVWEKQFDIQNPKIKGLLFKMAREMFISRYRRNKVAKKYIDSIRFNYEETFTVDSDIEYDELRQRYENALFKLPVTQREVFLMSRDEKLKYSEIAERLGISVKAVEKRMSAALAYLRNVLNFNNE